MSDPPPIFGTPREWAKDLTLATAIGVFLGVIGPFGSFYGAPIEQRIFFWVGDMWIGFAILSVVVRLSVRTAMRLDVPIWFALAMGVVLGSAPLSLVLNIFSMATWAGAHGRFRDLLAQYAETLAIAAPMAFLYYWIGVRNGQNAPLVSTPRPAHCPVEAGEAVNLDPGLQKTLFLDRMPPRVGRELLALQMEDHYVRAHTEHGSALILMSLKEAIAELGDAEGMQVHRSWWVARGAVADKGLNGRNLILRLKNGLQAPVSRPTVAKLKAAGWITDD
jgi:DNA-binding LytR/AlgR family response regulator